MATVALPSVGSRRTQTMDPSPPATASVAMLAHTVADRFSTWTRLEAKIDAWASYGALGLAAAATAALLLVGPF